MRREPCGTLVWRGRPLLVVEKERGRVDVRMIYISKRAGAYIEVR